MAVDVEELIIAPFREVVARGSEALKRAEAEVEVGVGAGAGARHDGERAAQMVKAAKAVVREGERALKRLQPLWDSQVERHGDVFKGAMSKNEHIEARLRKLEDLLYDFEDFTEVATFDEERYSGLQAAVKTLALYLLDVIKRLKMDRSQSHSQVASHSQGSVTLTLSPPPRPTTFPPLPPLPAHVRLASVPKRAPRISSADIFSIDAVDASVVDANDVDVQASRASSQIFADSLLEMLRATETAGAGEKTKSKSTGAGAGAASEREPESPVRKESREPKLRLFPVPRTQEWVKDQVASVDGSRARTRGPPPLLLKDEPVSNDLSIPIPRDEHTYEVINFDHVPSASMLSKLTLVDARGPPPPPLPLPPPPPSHPASGSSGRRLSSGSSLFSSSMSQALSSARSASTTLTVPESTGTEDWKSTMSDDMMQQTSSCSIRGRGSQEAEADCSIGPNSSLFRMKGFCEGAVAYRNQGLSHGIRKTSGYVAHHSTDIGRCVGCGYAHHFDELALDVNKDAKANFSNSGIRFRIRFLYKSHLTTNKMAEAYYGCLFCAHAGVTVSESDATVFQSSDGLFRHLARHPWPLPDVPGLTTLYGQDLAMDDARLQDFDVHFVMAPPSGGGASASGIPEAVLPDVGKRPMAVATKSHVQRFGEKKLPRPPGFVEKDLLQFFAGARLVGLEFPATWAGKWATAWHDGRWGVFAAKHVELELPRRHEAPPLHLASVQRRRTRSSTGRASAMASLAATSGPTVTARWKFEPADAAVKGWLAFDKGDVIRDVDWVYRDHWCWSGVNAKGKRGIFPRSHVNHHAVQAQNGDGDGDSPARQTLMSPVTSPRKSGTFRNLPRVLRRKASNTTLFGGGAITEIISR